MTNNNRGSCWRFGTEDGRRVELINHLKLLRRHVQRFNVLGSNIGSQLACLEADQTQDSLEETGQHVATEPRFLVDAVTEVFVGLHLRCKLSHVGQAVLVYERLVFLQLVEHGGQLVTRIELLFGQVLSRHYQTAQ